MVKQPNSRDNKQDLQAKLSSKHAYMDPYIIPTGDLPTALINEFNEIAKQKPRNYFSKRPPTEKEKEIMDHFYDKKITFRKLPHFLFQICSPSQLAYIEDYMSAHLDSRLTAPICIGTKIFELVSSNTIFKELETSISKKQRKGTEAYQFLNAVKQVFYDHQKHTFEFVLTTRKEAQRWEHFQMYI